MRTPAHLKTKPPAAQVLEPPAATPCEVFGSGNYSQERRPKASARDDCGIDGAAY